MMYKLLIVHIGLSSAPNFILFIIIFGSVEKGNLGVPQLTGQGCSFHSFRTNTYKLCFMESPSGIKVSQNILAMDFLFNLLVMHVNMCWFNYFERRKP